MAETRVKIVDIQINAAAAIKQLGEYAVAIDLAQAEQKKLRKEHKDGKIDVNQYKEQMAILKEVVKENQQAEFRLSQQIQSQNKMLKAKEGSIYQLKTELRAATLQYENMSRAERESATGTQLKAHLAEIKKELTSANLEATNMYKNMGDTSKVETGLGSITKKIKNMALQMGALATGGSIVRLGQSAVEMGRKFYDGMAQVKAVTQATDGEMSKLTDTARELGRTTKFHATDAAKAMENLSRGGFDTNEVLMSINTTLKMAQANAIDLDTSSDVLIRVLRGFKMPVDEKSVTRVSDVLSQAARKSNTTVTELAQAFKNAAPMAGALNIPIEQVSAALGVLADNGTKGADAGTAMRMALLGLSDPTTKAWKVFRQLGVNIDEVELKQKGLVGVMQELRDSGILKTENAMHQLGTIFGRRVTPAVVGLINNFDAYKNKLNEVNNAQGTTSQMFKQSLDPASLSLYTLSSAWEDFKISLYNLNTGNIKSFADTLTSLVQFLSVNLPTVAAVITNLIASFSLAKVAQGAIASVENIKNNIVQKATEASNAVQASQTKENLLRRQTTALTAEMEQLKATSTAESAERQKLIATQLATREQQLATQTATTAKLKTTEVEAWSNAKALSTGTGWARGMALAKIAFVGFAATAKAAIKSIGLIFAISLAIEGLTKLYDWVSGMFNKVDKEAEQHKAIMNEIAKQNDEITKAGVKQTAEEAARLNILHAAAQNVNRSNNERLAAIRKIQAVAPAYHATIDKTGKLIENNVNAIDDYIKKLRKKAEAEAAMSMYKKNAEKLLQLDMSDADSDQKIKSVKNAINRRRDTGQSKAKSGETQYATRDSKGNVEIISANEAEKRQRDQYYINKFNQRKQNNAQERAAINKQQQFLEKRYQAASNLQQEATKGKKKGGGTTNNIVREPSEADQKEQEKAAKAREAAANKAARIAETESAKEQKAIKAMHEAMEATMQDTIEKRRVSITNQYTDEINKLKSRLATERNLTDKAKDAINETIKYKQIKMNQELDKLSDESMKEELARQQKYIASHLSVAQKGSKEELDLKKQQIENNKKQNLLDLNKEEETAKQGKQDKVNTAKTSMDNAKAKLDKDKENGADVKTINADMQEYQQKVANYTHMQQELTDVTNQYEKMRADINEKARQDELRADQDFETQKEANRQMAVQTQITEMEASLLQDKDYQERKRAQQQLGVDVVNEEEMQQMQLERDNAQKHLDFIIEQGQLEGETQEQYQQREGEGRLALAQKNAEINNAEIKNEQAKQKAFESVGNNLINVFEAVGESNTALAKMAKVIALAQIAIDTGKAIAAMTAAEAGKGIAGIITTAAGIASILANIATAISTVKSAKFATGGKVVGPGTGTSDSIPAQLSNGEYVMTARATKMFEPLLAAMNGIGAGVPIASNRNYSVIQNTSDMTDSFTEAAQTIRPVVSVEEITDVQNRVETIQNIDNV